MLSKLAATSTTGQIQTSKAEVKTIIKPAKLKLTKNKNPAAPVKQQTMEATMQLGLDLCHKLGAFCKVDTTDFNMSPFDQTLMRIFGAYAKRARPSALYSNFRTVNMVGGRILFAAICCKAQVKTPFNASGCSLWNHQWACDGEDDDQAKVRCFHGDLMLRKENVMELLPSSEAGISALRDGKGTLSTNRWGKQSVRVKQETAAVCCCDNAQKFGNFSKSSCGLNFTDSAKACMAMRNACGSTEVMFPGAANASHLLFMPLQCECNYGGKSCMGRQVCKLTPFSVPGLENLAATEVDALHAPFVRNPAVFVFQCCNFTTSKRSNQKSCDFKLSHLDLLGALATARKLWSLTFNESMPITFEVFKWGPEKRVKNAALPEFGICLDAKPFGDLPDLTTTAATAPMLPPKAPRKRTLQMVVSSDSESEEVRNTTDEEVRRAAKSAKRATAASDDDEELTLVEDSQQLFDSEAEDM